MIRNYDELLICITKTEKQIPKLKTEKQKHIYNLNFKKAKIVLSQQQLIELQILNYIGYYQEKIKGSYLESKLYNPKLKTLKELYQTKTIAGDLIYCFMQLLTEYDELKKDLWIFSTLDLNHTFAVQEKIKKLLFMMEEIYFELANSILLSNEKIHEKQTIQYNIIVAFFRNYYTSQVENLQEKLSSVKSASKFISSLKKLVNTVTLKMIQFEIENKKETEEITIQLESLLRTKEHYNKLSQMVFKSISN